MCLQINRANARTSSRGFTLIEMLVAMAILAWIMVVSSVVVDTAGRSGEISERRSQQLKDIDRLWILLETDLRNSAARNYVPNFDPPIPAMLVSQTEEYVLSFIRTGQANPLLLPRSEVLRVAYRVEDEVLWRDSWIDPFNVDQELARPQKLLTGVERFDVLALPSRSAGGRSVSDGPWLDQWPDGSQASSTLPLALELKITLKKRGELRRFISLVPGE